MKRRFAHSAFCGLALVLLLAISCDGGNGGTGQTDTLYVDTLVVTVTLYDDTLTLVDTLIVAGTTDTLIIEKVFKLPYIGRAEHRVDVGALLVQNIAPTRMLPVDYVRTLTEIAVLTYEADEYFEFAWAFGDTIGWIDSVGSHVVVKWFLPDSTLKIVGWHIWDGVTVTEEYDLPINWEYVTTDTAEAAE